MVADFWKAVLLCQLGVAALIAVALAAATSLSLTIRMTVLACAFFCMPAAAIIVTLALCRRKEASGVTHWRYLLKAVLSDILWFNMAALAMSLEPRDTDLKAPATAPKSQPVLLIHGIMCNRGVWNHLMRRLQQEGIAPVVAVNLEPPLRSIESHAQAVARQLRELQAEARGSRIAIVAHSMGGLVARAALRAVGPAVISQIVTVGSPHHGTIAARYVRLDPGRQMRPESTWLSALNEAQEGRFEVPMTSIYSLEDWLIRPPLSAMLGGAELRELRGIGHMGLLRDARAIDWIVSALQR